MTEKKKTGEKIVNEKNEVPRERVTVFGDELSGRDYKRRDDGTVFGVMLITGGIILFLNTSGALPWTVWDYVWRFWPLLFILWGLQVILGTNFVTRPLMNLLGAAMVVLVGMFAVYQVQPSLLQGLPQQFIQIFDIMKGVLR